MDRKCYCENCQSTYTISWAERVTVAYDDEDYIGDELDEMEPTICPFCAEDIDGYVHEE